MNAKLDPRTEKKIKAFASRRRELLLLRGICALVGLLLLTMTGLALIDRFVIMPDKLRWFLSMVGYAAVAVVVWKLSLRHLLGKPSPQEVARLVERADPSMREDLISAIELGDPKNLKESHDSERFRELVQEDVGARAEKIDVPKLLPLSMLKKWLLGAGAAALFVVLLTVVPGLHFGQLFARALLPGVDLARPSNLKIEFLEPAPVDGIVAANEAVAVRVTITGGNVKRAELEAREAGGGAETIRLTRELDNQFVGSLMIKREDVEYRVRSGGAITKFHLLESRGRPNISLFSKTYKQPSYTETAAYTREEDHGDLSAIEGTMVSLSLKPDQEISKGELRLKSDRADVGDLTIPLEIDEDGNLTAEVPISTDHSLYRVHLEAKESGFTNKHSPDYEIRAVPDLTPELQITQPSNNLEIRHDANLELRGFARDDVRLKEVKQAYRINRSDWREVVLHTDCGTEQMIDHRWSLRGVGVKPGDLLVIKLIGIDSKGNVGESTPVRLAVTGWDEDPAKREWAEKEKSVAGALDKVAKETREMADAVEKAKEAMKKQPAERSLEEQQAVVRAQNETEQANAKAEQALEEMKEALAEAPTRAEAEEMQAAAEALADFKNQNLERVAEQVAEMAKGEMEEPKDGHQRPQHLAWEAANRAEVLKKAMNQIAAEDNAAIAADDAGHLEDRQEEIAKEAREMPKDGEAEAALLKEEQEVAAARAEAIEEDLRDLAKMLEGGQKNQAEQTAQRLDEQGKKLEEQLAKEDFAKELPQAAQQMEQRLEDVERNAQALEQQTAQLAEQAREELFRKQEPASKAIEEAKWQAEQAANEAGDVEKRQADANSNKEQLASKEAELEEKNEQLAENLESLAEQFEDLADIEDASPVGDSQQAADLNQVARALDDLANRAQDAESQEESQQVAQDLAKLQEAVEAMEAGENANDLAEALAELEQSEKGEPDAENADAWDVAEQQLKDLPQDLQRVENSQEAQKQAQQAANSQESRALENEMRQREQAAARNDENRQPQPMAENLDKLQEQVAEVAEKMAPAVEQAREDLAEMAPTVPEMLRDLAEQVGENQQAAEELAEQAQGAEASEAENIAQQAEEMLAENAQAAERLEEAMDALRHEANAEDYLSEEGRERARDADDAAAQLAQAEAEKAQDQLEQAANSQQPQQQSKALEAAAKEQGKLAETLNDLADKLEGVEKDGALAEESREALREMEQDLGVEETLDDAFEQAENLAEMMAAAEQNPAAALDALEQELAQNPAMQEALQALSENMVAEAAEQMTQAAQQESQVGEQLANAEGSPPRAAPVGQEPSAQPSAEQAMSQAAQQQESINESVTEAGASVERAARHEERLGNETAAESLAQMGESAQELAQQGEAAQALESMQQPASQSPAQAAQQAKAAESAISEQAQAMAASSQAQSQSPSQPSQASPASSPSEAAQAEMLAQALDSLDQMMAAQAQGAQLSPASQQVAAEAQAAAQQALAQAAQAQAQAMAQARAQGEMSSPPSQSAQAQAMAQAESQPGQPSQAGKASESQQGAQLQPGASGAIAGSATPNVDGADVGENWSKLPPKVAKDIIEAQRQGVAPEYRSAVESYYKALADRARKKKSS